ncbi:Peroxidase [Rhynchospora pubera]|uniref:Peroxidase n=1 Tax=Rhynchospora pubera TaxID=906938 RepID=A0AAV8CB36_9POAL|nr:Peroxidase [Rhynchospora pubera]
MHQGLRTLLALVLILSSISVSSSSSSDLSPDFYAFTCPNVQLFVRNTVSFFSTNDGTIPGKLLRLVFHDCMVEGCDASVLIQGNGTERTDPANLSLGGFDVVESAKRLIEVMCPGIVSCADILVLAARDAVEFTGGPLVQVPLGRKDGRVSLASNVRPNIIDTSFSVEEMAKTFSSKGLSMEDLVVLSGGHTIGLSHCTSFSDRFQKDANGSMVPIDTSMEKNFASELMKKCSANATAATTVSCDPVTPNQFDNQYFTNLLNGKGLLRSDSELVNDPKAEALIDSFSKSQNSFFDSWAESFIKMTSIGVKTGDDEGEIRTVCSSANG